MKKTSGTDWERLNAMSDEDIDTSDIPELDDEFFVSSQKLLADPHGRCREAPSIRLLNLGNNPTPISRLFR